VAHLDENVALLSRSLIGRGRRDGGGLDDLTRRDDALPRAIITSVPHVHEDTKGGLCRVRDKCQCVAVRPP